MWRRIHNLFILYEWSTKSLFKDKKGIFVSIHIWCNCKHELLLITSLLFAKIITMCVYSKNSGNPSKNEAVSMLEFSLVTYLLNSEEGTFFNKSSSSPWQRTVPLSLPIILINRGYTTNNLSKTKKWHIHVYWWCFIIQ